MRSFRHKFTHTLFVLNATVTRSRSTGGSNAPRLKKKSTIRKVNVAILGAASAVGEVTALNLKAEGKINNLTLYDDCLSLKGIAVDLKMINTNTRVTSTIGLPRISSTLKEADIVLLVGGHPANRVYTDQETFEKNAEIVASYAKACSVHCPEALVVMAIEPINATLPLFSQIYSDRSVVCPNKLMGSVTLDEINMRAFIAEILELNPSIVKVDLLGGACPSTMVPLVSSCQPVPEALRICSQEIGERMVKISQEMRMNPHKLPRLSAGYALSLLINHLTDGLRGRGGDQSLCVFVKSSVAPGIKYVTLRAKFGASGLILPSSLPPMSDYEMSTFSSIMPKLNKLSRLGEEEAKEDKGRDTFFIDECETCSA